MVIMIVFWMKLSVIKKLSLNRILVLIVMMNHIDDNNNNSIFNVVLRYIIIKYQYVNILWIFVCFFSVFSCLLESVMFILI